MNAPVSVVLSAAFLATLPLAAYLEKRKDSPKLWRILRITAFFIGVLGATVTSAVFASTVKAYPADTAAWARDFYFGYLKTLLPGFSVVLVLLSVARMIDHPMRRTVSALEILLSVAVILVTLFAASMASGDIAVDRFIYAVSPFVILMGHLSGIFCKKR